MTATTRRAALGGLAGASVLAAIPPALASAASPADDIANRLWAQRHAYRQPYRDACMAVRRATAQLPDWARPGPSLLHPDGTLSDDGFGWPAIQGVTPDEHDVILIRPGKHHLAERYHRDLILRPETALSDYQRELRELALRRRAQRDEKRKVGLPALEAKRDRISDQRQAIQEQIEELEPDTANSAAALVLVEAVVMCHLQEPFFDYSDGPAPEVALKFLRPMLSGLIRAHVDEIFDRPVVPSKLLQAVHHSGDDREN